MEQVLKRAWRRLRSASLCCGPASQQIRTHRIFRTLLHSSGNWDNRCCCIGPTSVSQRHNLLCNNSHPWAHLKLSGSWEKKAGGQGLWCSGKVGERGSVGDVCALSPSAEEAWSHAGQRALGAALLWRAGCCRTPRALPSPGLPPAPGNGSTLPGWAGEQGQEGRRGNSGHQTFPVL